MSNSDLRTPFRRVLEPSNPHAPSFSTILDPADQPREEYDADGYYIPDPHARWYEKLNPCHCDHLPFLTRAQRLFEFFGSHCRCCSGVRVAFLAAAWVLGLTGSPVPQVISMFLVLMVIYAVILGFVGDKAREYYEQKDENDNSNP